MGGSLSLRIPKRSKKRVGSESPDPRAPERLSAPTRGFPHLLEGKQLAEPSGRRTMEGNELEIISAPSLPSAVRAPLFAGPARGGCHSTTPSGCPRARRSPPSAPQTWCLLGLPFISVIPYIGRGGCVVFTLLLKGSLLKATRQFSLSRPGPPTTQVMHTSNLNIPNLLPNSNVPSSVPPSGPRPLTLRPPSVSEVPPWSRGPRPGFTIWRAREEGRIQTQAFTPPPPPPPTSRPDKGAEAKRERDPAPLEKRSRSPCRTGVRT